LAHDQPSLPRDDRRVADFDPGDVGDGVEGAGDAVEGDAEVAGAGMSPRTLGRGNLSAKGRQEHNRPSGESHERYETNA
jgi:hypothetical protein